MTERQGVSGQGPDSTEQPPQDPGSPPPAGDLQLDEASGIDVPPEAAPHDGDRDDVPVFEDPNDR